MSLTDNILNQFSSDVRTCQGCKIAPTFSALAFASSVEIRLYIGAVLMNCSATQHWNLVNFISRYGQTYAGSNTLPLARESCNWTAFLLLDRAFIWILIYGRKQTCLRKFVVVFYYTKCPVMHPRRTCFRTCFASAFSACLSAAEDFLGSYICQCQYLNPDQIEASFDSGSIGNFNLEGQSSQSLDGGYGLYRACRC